MCVLIATFSERIPIFDRTFRHKPRSFISLSIGYSEPFEGIPVFGDGAKWGKSRKVRLFPF